MLSLCAEDVGAMPNPSNFLASRHPDRSARPTFSDILQILSPPALQLLSWLAEDTELAHPMASILGATMNAGRSLYPDLQNKYVLFHEEDP